MRTILLVTLLALSLPLSPALAGSDPAEDVAFSQAELTEASDILSERLAGCSTESTCTMLYAKIALVERPGGAVEKMAYDGLTGSLGHSRKGLTWVFSVGDAEARRRVLDLYREYWAVLGRGFDPNLSDKCIRGLEDESPLVRAAAARLIASYPVPGTANAAIDAATLDPGLTRHVLHAIAISNSVVGARWVGEQLSSEDPLVRGTAKRTLFLLGRRAVGPLKDAIAGDDAERRTLALDALLPMANPEDVSLLYEWLTTHGESEPELRDRVLRVVAEIESGLYEGEPPPLVPLDEPDAG